MKVETGLCGLITRWRETRNNKGDEYKGDFVCVGKFQNETHL